MVPNKQAYPIPQGIPTSTDAFASAAPATQGTLIDLGAHYIVFFELAEDSEDHRGRTWSSTSCRQK